MYYITALINVLMPLYARKIHEVRFRWRSKVLPEEILILQQAMHSINLGNRGDILESDAAHACKANVLPSNDRPPEIV